MERKSPFTVGAITLAWGLALFWIGRQMLASDLRDPDLWWHLASGRAMLENHSFLKTDIFSFTKLGQPWINFEWLSQIIFYAIQRSVGLFGLYLTRVVLVGVSLLFLFLSIRKAGARGPGLLFLFLLGFCIIKSRIACRPEIFTLVFFPLFIWLSLHVASPIVSSQRRWPWIFFVMTILWVNLHAGFIYGLAILILSAVGLRWGRASSVVISLFDRASILCSMAVFISPSGIRLGHIFYEHMRQLVYGPKNIISEWSATDVGQHGYFWGVYFLSALFLILIVLKRQQILFRWIPMVLIFLLWGGLYTRNTALLAFVAMPFIAEATNHLFVPKRRGLFWILALCPLVGNVHAFFQSPPKNLLDPRWTPVRACEFLQANNIQENLYNTYHYGGYISWKLGPLTKIFWDGRYIFHPMMVDYLQTNEQFLGNPASNPWPEYLARYGITSAIVEPPRFRVPLPNQSAGFTDAEALFPRSQWALVFWDDAALVYLKRIPSHQQIIHDHEYRWAYPENLERLKLDIQNNRVPLAELKKELQQHDADMGFTFLSQIQEQLLP